jgi:HEPN domain-containing protein
MPQDNDAGSPREWLRYAEADLNLARMPLPEGTMHEQLCFHAQQAAEKALKAVLVSLGSDFPHTHDLRILTEIISRQIAISPSIAKFAGLLTPYAVAFRYPGGYEPVQDEERQEAVSAARDVVEWARQYLSQLSG